MHNIYFTQVNLSIHDRDYSACFARRITRHSIKSSSFTMTHLADAAWTNHSSQDAVAMEQDTSSSLSPHPPHELRNTICVTLLIVTCFIFCKNSYDCLRQWGVHLNVIIIGSGPIGLVSALIASYSDKVANIVVFEEKNRAQLFVRPQQIALDSKSIEFLKT